MTQNLDPKSPVWLQSSVRYARLEYRREEDLAKELVDADAVHIALNAMLLTMPNQQLIETGRIASEWVRDLILCEEERELAADLKQLKVAYQVVVDLCEKHRCIRGSRRQ